MWIDGDASDDPQQRTRLVIDDEDCPGAIRARKMDPQPAVGLLFDAGVRTPSPPQ
jgi:hypothetical protein